MYAFIRVVKEYNINSVTLIIALLGKLYNLDVVYL
jgi:hypothetical protein